jgi:hypothetical protein
MPLVDRADNTRVTSVRRPLEAATTSIIPASIDHTTVSYGIVPRKNTLLREKLFLWIDVVIPATEPGDWRLLEKPLGVMPGRRFLLTLEGNMSNNKPLEPDDLPVEVEGEEFMIATTTTRPPSVQRNWKSDFRAAKRVTRIGC